MNNSQFICELKIKNEKYTIRHCYGKYEYKNANKTAKFVELSHSLFPMTRDNLLNISNNLTKALIDNSVN